MLLSGHGIVFNGQLLDFLSKSWTLMIFVDPTSSAGCSRIPLLPTHWGDATTKGNRSTEGLCTERFIDWKLALDQTLGKKKQNKGLQPSSLLSRKYSKHLREAAHFLTQLCMARGCWLSTKRRTPEWGMVMAPAEALDCSQGVFQRLCRKRRWHNTWKSSLSLRADFQSGQYKNTSSVHGFNYSPEPNCFRKWEWSQKMRKLLMDALFTAP